MLLMWPPSNIKITTIRAPGNDDYTELIESEINNQKKSSSGITRFIKNVIGMTSGKKYTYRKHEGDLNASEITMADDERIELMLMVKEGKISMHDAVERVKAYERQHRCIEKSSPEKEGEHKRSPQLSSLLRRKSSDSRGSGSQESPRSKKSSSSTESSPGQRSRSGSRSWSRSATQTLVDFCPEEQLIVELSHPEGSTGVSSPGGATNISISVKPIDRPEPPPVKPKPKKDGGQGVGQQQGDSGAVLGCATPMCWMSPKRSRKYISSSPESTLTPGSSPGVGELEKSKQVTQAETHSTPHKSKKGSPSGGSSGGGGEQKQRSFLRSPFSRRKRSSSSSSNSAKESPAKKPEEQKQYSQTLGRGPRPEPPPRTTYSGPDPTQASISSSGTQARTAQGAIATPSHTDSREASRSHTTPTEQVYQHANLLYRKGSTSSSSSNSIQSQRDPRLLEAALLGQKRVKSPSPSPSSGSVQSSSASPSSIVQPKRYSSNNGSSSKGQGSKAASKASNGVSTPSKQGSGNSSRIPSYYSNPQRRSLNLSDGPDICSDSSSEGGRTRRSRTNSDAHSSNGTLKGSIRKSDYRSSSNDSLKKSSNNRTSGQLRKGKQPPKLTLPTSDGNHTGSDSDTSRTLSRSQVTRSSSGSRLPVNFRSSVDSLPRSPVSSSPRSPVCKQPQTDTLSKRHSGSHRNQNSNTSTDVELRRRASATTRQGSKGTSTSSKICSKEVTPRVHKTNGNDVTERRRRTSQLSVGSDTSNTSVESKRPAEQIDRTRIPRSTSGSTTNDECLTSDYDDGDMSDKNPDMFVRNSATRSSLSERMKGLGRDVKKKISRLKPNRMSMSKDPDEITSGACGDGSRSPDESRHSVLGLHAVSSSSGHSSLSQDETDATYRGPFVGRAKVIRDYTPSPYDREALTLKQGDVISIISMNETGMWRGMVGHRIGTFKFINVEMLPAESPQPSPIKRQPRMRGPRRPRPRTVHELLLRLGLSHLTTVFLLHGYHTLELFSELEEEDLDELCITVPEDRAKIITAAQLLVDYDNTESPESGTGSRPQTPAGLSLTPAGSTHTLTDQPTATPPEALPGYGPPAPHCLSALRAKPPRDTTSYVHIALDLRDSGCYASSETLQMQHGDGGGGTPSRLATVNAGPTTSSTTGETTGGEEGGQSIGSEQPNVNSSQGEGIEGGGQGNGQEDHPQRHSGSDTGPVPVLSVPPEGGSEGKGEEDSPKTDTPSESSQTTTTSVPVLPHSTREENGAEEAPEDADTTSESLDVFSRDSTPCSSPRIRVRPRVPMRRTSASPTSMVTTFGVGGGCTEETTTSAEGTCELSPMRRFRPGGPAQRLSSQSSQNSISPCGSPPQGSPMSPLGSPHTQTRSQSLPGSPLRSHSPSMLVHLPPRPHSPILHQHHPVHHRATGSHRYSTPNIHALKQRLRPQIPERTSSLSSKTFSGSTDSINSGTQTPQLIYAENGINPTLGRQQNGHLHMRRSSSPALRTYMSFTPPGSPQKSKLPTYNTSKTGSLPAGLVTRTNGGGSRRRQKAVSVTLEAIVVAKLDEEGIDLTQPPYTDTSGFCGIPPALVQRYAEELRREVAEIATAIDECRTRHLQNNGQVAVPNDFLVDSCNTPSFDIATSSVPDFLVSIGMPMYLEALVENDRETIEEVKEMRESDWKKIGVTDPRHLRRLAQSAEILRARLIHADKQKQLRIAKLSQIRDKV